MSCGVEYKKFDERHSCVRPEGHDGSHRCGCGATMKPNDPSPKEGA